MRATFILCCALAAVAMATPRGVERITPAVREISEIEALMQSTRA